MKTLDDYMELSYRMEIVKDKDESGYVLTFPELPGCMTCGETIEKAVENAEDAKRAWIEAALEGGIEIQEPGCLPPDEDDLTVAKWKINGVKRILQAFQAKETEDTLDDDVCFVLAGSLDDALKLLDGIHEKTI